MTGNYKRSKFNKFLPILVTLASKTTSLYLSKQVYRGNVSMFIEIKS